MVLGSRREDLVVYFIHHSCMMEGSKVVVGVTIALTVMCVV